MNRYSDVPLEGEFNCWTSGFDLPDIMLAVCDTRKTGLLRFVSAEAEKKLFIREGKIIFASSSSEDDRLGEYLLRQGRISLQDLQRFVGLVRPGKRLGTLLVEDGLLEPKDLVQAVIGQVRAIILSLFRWTEARYGFDEQELPSKETITLNMPSARLIIDGVRLIDSWRRIAQGVGDMRSVYRRAPGSEDAVRSIDLDTATLEVLAMLIRPHSVEEACSSSELADIDVCRMMWVFRCLGWIERVEANSAVIAGDGEPMVAVPLPTGGEETGFDIVEAEPLGGGEVSQAPPAEPSSKESRPVVTAIAPETARGVTPDSRDPLSSAEAFPLSAETSQEASPRSALGSPGEETPPPPAVTESSKEQPPSEKAASADPTVLEAEDMDLEGLGMVLGEDDSK